MNFNEFKLIPELAVYLGGADHVDVRVGQGECSLREFVAGVLSYQPGWMGVLWKIRMWLLRLLGQNEKNVPVTEPMTAESLSVEVGQKAAFFTVAASDSEQYWVAIGEESHLGAAIAVLAEPIDGNVNKQRFHLMTVVKYRSWVGPVYFNIIRPFHHLVVYAAMRSILSKAKA